MVQQIKEKAPMADKIKNIALCVLTLSVIGLVIFCTYQISQKEKAEAKASTNQKTVNQAAKIINRYIDTSGRKHAVIAADENKLNNNWYKDGTAISGGFIDTVAAALQIARKQLQEAIQINSTTKAENLAAKKKIDSLQRTTYYYKDRYLQLAYRPPLKLGDTTDNGTFDFAYNDSINVVQYWKKSWILGAKKSYIDIYSNDPRTTINGVKRLVVKQNSPTFGLRVQAVSNYSFSRKTLNLGPGIQFDIGRTSVIGTYYYDTDLNQWRPSVGLRYDIARF